MDRFQSPRGETPCSGPSRSLTKAAASRWFQSPLGEIPCSGARKAADKAERALAAFQSPLGETPWSGFDVRCYIEERLEEFQSPRGETPWSGEHLDTVFYAPDSSFNPHAGKHPGPGQHGVRGRFQESPVSIPTRGNTLVRGKAGGMVLPGAGVRPGRVVFQSPRGETPWSGSTGGCLPSGAGGGVSIPTRGNTLFRAQPPAWGKRFWRRCFNPHAGKHPGPGTSFPFMQTTAQSCFNPHSGKHPVPGPHACR